MTSITDPDRLESIARFEDFRAVTARWVLRVSQALRGNIDFVENVRASGPHVVSLSSSADTSVPHSLGVIPRGRIVIDQLAAGSVLRGTAPWTASTISLRGSTSFTATILVI